MSPGKLNSRILADRVAWINRMLEEIGKLPFGTQSSALALKNAKFKDLTPDYGCLRCRRGPPISPPIPRAYSM